MKRIILDCDPGHDDMIAIMVACAAVKEVQLMGITTVAGNQTVEKTFLNAKKILTMIGRTDIPVAKGAKKPLMRPLIAAEFIHGESGLEGAQLAEPSFDGLSCSARDFLVDTLLSSDEPITLVPTGPLTNIATVLLSAPEVFEKIEEIVLIGGAIHDSNITPGAEFNIYVDPEAAKIVFTSGLLIRQIGLDVTNKTLLTYSDIDCITEMDGPVSSFVGPLLKYFADTNKKNFGIEGAPVHDALAVSAAIWPEVITTRNYNVTIETAGEFTVGQTVTDIYGITGNEPNAQVAVEVNVEQMRRIMIDTISFLDTSAPGKM